MEAAVGKAWELFTSVRSAPSHSSLINSAAAASAARRIGYRLHQHKRNNVQPVQVADCSAYDTSLNEIHHQRPTYRLRIRV